MLSAASQMLQFHHPRKGRTLVIGNKLYKSNADRRELYPGAVGLDMLPGDGVDIVHDLEQPLDGQYDHVDCCSVLEHVRRPWLLAENIERLMAPGATILCVVPFVWRVHGYPSDYWRFTKEALDVLFPNVDWYEKLYHSNGAFVDKAPANRSEGAAWFRRTELAAWGVKCG